jgi:hypothetical protein
MYMCNTPLSASCEEADDNTEDTVSTEAEKVVLTKTRSCENLMSLSDENPVVSGRRLSDPNIRVEPNLLVQDTSVLDNDLVSSINNCETSTTETIVDNCDNTPAPDDSHLNSISKSTSNQTSQTLSTPLGICCSSEHLTHMSTSTSDISDSHVNIDFKSKLNAKKPCRGAHIVDEALLGLDIGSVSLEAKRQLRVDLSLCSSSPGSCNQSETSSTPSPSSDKVHIWYHTRVTIIYMV